MDTLFFIYGIILTILTIISLAFVEDVLEAIVVIAYLVFIGYSTYIFWERRKEEVYKRR